MNEQQSLVGYRQAYQRKLMVLLCWTLSLSAIVSLLFRNLLGPPLPLSVALIIVAYALGMLALIRLSDNIGGSCEKLLVLTGLLLAVFTVAYHSGGVNAPVMLLLPLLPLLMAQLFGHCRIPLYVLIVGLLLFGLLLGQRLGWVQPLPFSGAVRSSLQSGMLVITVFASALLGWYYERHNHNLQNQLSQWANIDGLTGVANRRFFNDWLQQEWLRNQRVGQPISLLLVDIDHFKRYNDDHGHVEGDRCLVAVAQTLASHCRRAGELVARYGGEEFAVILPNVDLAEAAAISDSLCSDVASLYRQGHPALLESVTISIGFTTAVPRQAEQRDGFINQADEALYRAKRAGRNQSVGTIAQVSQVNAGIEGPGL